MLSVYVTKSQPVTAHLEDTEVRGHFCRGHWVEGPTAPLKFHLTTAVCANGLVIFVRIRPLYDLKQYLLQDYF